MHDTTGGHSLRAPAQLNSSSIEAGSVKIDLDPNDQLNLLPKEDCTVSSSSKESGANINERLKQIELN